MIPAALFLSITVTVPVLSPDPRPERDIFKSLRDILFQLRDVHYIFLQTKWEQTTDKKIQRNTIHRRMESLLRQQKYSLEERRDQ